MKIKALGILYDFPTRPLELGEQRKLKREFGFVPGRDELDLQDPDHLGAFLYAAMRNADSDASFRSIMSAIGRIREIEIVGDDGEPLTDDDELDETPEPESDPPSAVPEPGVTGD